MSDQLRPNFADDPDARWEALARHLSGESDAGESAAVTAWLAGRPGDAALLEMLSARTVRAERAAEVPVDTEAALAQVRARMQAEAGSASRRLTVERGGLAAGSMSRRHQPQGANQASAGRSWRRIGLAAAAGLVAVVGVAQWRGGFSAKVSQQEFRTAVGQRDSVHLPDGTVVLLAPGSHLTVAANYGRDAREVTLDGAAFFEVQHDAARPFTVHTTGADIRDIGTAFTVRTAADGGVSVGVTHGSVAMSAPATSTSPGSVPAELRAGDRGTLAGGTVVVQRGVVTAEDVAWTRGQLAYRDTPLSEVQADLMRWYGIDLRVTDSTLAHRTLTATFKGDSASQIIHLIALALGADAVQKGDTILLQPQGSGTPNP